MTGHSEIARVVERHVLDYLAARLAWELEAHQLNEQEKHQGMVGTTMDAIQASYMALLFKFFESEALAREPRATFDDPPSVDPARTRVSTFA